MIGKDSLKSACAHRHTKIVQLLIDVGIKVDIAYYKNSHYLKGIIEESIDRHFPKKKIKIFRKDKEWMTEKIQRVRRQKAQEYRRRKKSAKFIQLQNKYKQMKKAYKMNNN